VRRQTNRHDKIRTPTFPGKVRYTF